MGQDRLVVRGCFDSQTGGLWVGTRAEQYGEITHVTVVRTDIAIVL